MFGKKVEEKGLVFTSQRAWNKIIKLCLDVFFEM